MTFHRWLGNVVLWVLTLFFICTSPGCSDRSSPKTDEPAASDATAPQPKPGSPENQADDRASSAKNPARGEARNESAPAEAPKPRKVTLPEGTELVVRTTSRISTKSNQSGQTFAAVLEQPIVDDDWVIAKSGASVEGLISECDPGGRVQGVARLEVTLERLTLTDGRRIDIRTSSIGRQARTTKKKDAQKIGIGAGIGAAIGAIAGGGKGAAIGAAVGGGGGTGVVLATHGEPATIASESKLTFKLREPVTITKE